MYFKHLIEAIEKRGVSEIEHLEYYKEYLYEYFKVECLFCIHLGGGETLIALSEWSVIEVVEDYYSLKGRRGEDYKQTKELVTNALMDVKVL